jgi:hypothetical protein
VTSHEIRLKGPKRSKRSQPFEVPTAAEDAQVLTLREWCQLNKISPRTAHRILKRPDGPIVTMMSPKRIGITIGNNRACQESRARRAVA